MSEFFYNFIERIMWRHYFKENAKERGISVEEFFDRCDRIDKKYGEQMRRIGRECGVIK